MPDAFRGWPTGVTGRKQVREMNFWEQQAEAINYARNKGIKVENVRYMYNYVPAMEVKEDCFIVFGNSVFKFGGGTVGPLAREVSPEEMEEIIYLARAYMRSGVHGMLQVVLCAEANNRNEAVFDREAIDLDEGRLPADVPVIEYRKKYLSEMGIQWHIISDKMRIKLESLIK